MVKTYYVAAGFETLTASYPVPVEMAGGKKFPEIDALTMAYRAIQEGAAGVDMDRNIFQAGPPSGMIQVVRSGRVRCPKNRNELTNSINRSKTTPQIQDPRSRGEHGPPKLYAGGLCR